LSQFHPGKERLEVIPALYMFKKIPGASWYESFRKDPTSGPSWYESFRKDPTPGPSWYESFRKDPTPGPSWYGSFGKDPTPGPGDTSLVCIHAHTRTELV
jgi:hypothetical protein